MVIKQLKKYQPNLNPVWLFVITLLISSCSSIDLSFIGLGPDEEDEEQTPILAELQPKVEEKKNWCFSMKVPDGNWSLRLDKLYQKSAQEYVALGVLWRKKGSGLQVIGRRTMCAPVTIDDKQVAVIITGKSWEWRNQENATFTKKLPEIDPQATLIYEFDPTAPPIKPVPAGNPDQ
jgi:hypothetical protein